MNIKLEFIKEYWPDFHKPIYIGSIQIPNHSNIQSPTNVIYIQKIHNTY
jgi:hypothetical protein